MDIIEDEYLNDENKIVHWFKDCGHEYFECGQGYYQEDVEICVKIGAEYFKVQIYAEIESSKQDRGDRLYWVEKITEVKYSKISIDEMTQIINANIWKKIEVYEQKIDKLKLQIIE